MNPRSHVSQVNGGHYARVPDDWPVGAEVLILPVEDLNVDRPKTWLEEAGLCVLVAALVGLLICLALYLTTGVFTVRP